MPDEPKAPRSIEAPQATKKAPVDLGKSNYSPEELEKLLRGEVTFRELGDIGDEKLLEIAETAYSMLMSGKLKEARVLFTGLIAVEPLEPYYRVALGCVYMGEENWARAEEVFNEALRLNPNDSNALVNRAEVRLRLGHLEAAAQDLHQVVTLDPEGKEQATHRARAIAAFAMKSIEEAQKAAQEASKGAPPSVNPPKSSGRGKKK